MEYILIISDEHDISTNHVIDWLNYLNKPVIRINDTDVLSIKEFIISNNKIIAHLEFDFFGTKKILRLEDIKSVWYRRGNFNLKIQYLKHNDSDIQYNVNRYLLDDKIYIENFINQYLRSKKHINSFLDNDMNKLHNLFIASSVGLSIPSTTILNKKSTLLLEQKNHKKLITKAIINGVLKFNSNSGIGFHTNLLEKKDILNLPENFGLSLVQPCLDKAYELRIFYLNNTFYPMAIFSQNDKKTKIDFRNYNYEKPNRTVPYILPNELKSKLLAFIKKTNVNSGSIDVVVTKSKKYIFLEINPIGQFQQVSRPCNYFIEKAIAHYL